MSYKYKNVGFLLWQDSTFNVYAAIRIWNLCCEDMKYETDNMLVRLDVMGLSTFMIFYV